MPQNAEIPAASPEDAEKLASAWDQLLYTIGAPPSVLPDRQRSALQNRSKIPVTVLSGFLGAGKTTLLCALLAEYDGNLLAIVNDLAAVNIDAALVSSTTTETMELANGCACCVLGNDLDEMLSEIGTRENPPHAIVIEASGISDPAGFAQTIANNDATVLDGIVTVVDVTRLRNQLDDPLAAPLLKRQLAAAHLVALSKSTPQHNIAGLRVALSELVPGRPIVALSEAEGALSDLILGASYRGARPSPALKQHGYGGFSARVMSSHCEGDAGEFFTLLDNIPGSVYRIKGEVTLLEQQGARRYRLQAAGPHWRVEVLGQAPEAPQLVVIGRSEDPEFTVFCTELSKALGQEETSTI